MRLIAVTKHKYTMERWTAHGEYDSGNNLVISYVFDSIVRGTISSGKQQTYLFTETALAVGDQLREVKDADGEYVFAVNGESYNVWVHSSTPVVDVYGRVSNNRQVLRSTAPADPVGGSH